jgi:hypothetical protein
MSPRKNELLVFLLLLVFSFSGALAQAAAPPAAESPESVVQRYTAAMKAGDYQKTAELMHPEALEKFRNLLLPLLDVPQGADKEQSALPLFRGAKDVAAVKKLSPTEFFASFMGGLIDSEPLLKDALGSAGMTPIGSVPEGDVLHVVCRTSVAVQGVSLSKLEVVSVKRSAGNWRILLSGELEGMAELLRATMSHKQ